MKALLTFTATTKTLLLFLSLCPLAITYAGESAVVTTYQPIITGSESHPKGFAIMPIPFLSFHHDGKPAYRAVAHPHELLTDAPREIRTDDANLLSVCGINIAYNPDDNEVRLLVNDFRPSPLVELDIDAVTEAALECIRLLAHEAKERPSLIISGKPGEEDKWQLWQKTFSEHDLSQPFKQPGQ